MPTFCINFSNVGIHWLKRCSLTGPLDKAFYTYVRFLVSDKDILQIFSNFLGVDKMFSLQN